MPKSPRVKGYRSQRCGQGHRHDSIAEAVYCDQLELLRKAGEIKSYRTQVTYSLKVNGKKICGHRVDFEVVTNEDILEVHEVKGFATEVWRIKHKLFEACYPDIPYHIIRV